MWAGGELLGWGGLGELRAALIRASDEKAVEKLKQLLACVVDTILVGGRNHIQLYYFVPGALKVFPSRRRREHCKNPKPPAEASGSTRGTGAASPDSLA